MYYELEELEERYGELAEELENINDPYEKEEIEKEMEELQEEINNFELEVNYNDWYANTYYEAERDGELPSQQED